MANNKYIITIIGLGLMGGSLAMALKGYNDAYLRGVDVSKEVCDLSVSAGILDEASTDARAMITDSDLVIFCVYAHNIPEILKNTRDCFKPGAVISDICGVKLPLYESIRKLIPSQASYIGIHPMAGKERDGFINADPAIYDNSGFIICKYPVLPELDEDELTFTEYTTPFSLKLTAKNESANIELMMHLAEYIGATRIRVADAKHHDFIIGYTSDLMHISASALVLEYSDEMSGAFTAGAFRDSTRVADINAGAWTELLMDNRANTLYWLERYTANLEEIAAVLKSGDK
ncbi:MAG: prephenate dehydrogenase, partial [Clostridiales Family XIII bacterium]|nr:prephenate dehydrogenase [Clostridiales Family XIII bacterium]